MGSIPWLDAQRTLLDAAIAAGDRGRLLTYYAPIVLGSGFVIGLVIGYTLRAAVSLKRRRAARRRHSTWR